MEMYKVGLRFVKTLSLTATPMKSQASFSPAAVVFSLSSNHIPAASCTGPTILPLHVPEPMNLSYTIFLS